MQKKSYDVFLISSVLTTLHIERENKMIQIVFFNFSLLHTSYSHTVRPTHRKTRWHFYN